MKKKTISGSCLFHLLLRTWSIIIYLHVNWDIWVKDTVVLPAVFLPFCNKSSKKQNRYKEPINLPSVLGRIELETNPKGNFQKLWKKNLYPHVGAGKDDSEELERKERIGNRNVCVGWGCPSKWWKASPDKRKLTGLTVLRWMARIKREGTVASTASLWLSKTQGGAASKATGTWMGFWWKPIYNYMWHKLYVSNHINYNYAHSP